MKQPLLRVFTLERWTINIYGIVILSLYTPERGRDTGGDLRLAERKLPPSGLRSALSSIGKIRRGFDVKSEVNRTRNQKFTDLMLARRKLKLFHSNNWRLDESGCVYRNQIKFFSRSKCRVATKWIETCFNIHL